MFTYTSSFGLGEGAVAPVGGNVHVPDELLPVDLGHGVLVRSATDGERAEASLYYPPGQPGPTYVVEDAGQGGIEALCIVGSLARPEIVPTLVLRGIQLGAEDPNDGFVPNYLPLRYQRLHNLQPALVNCGGREASQTFTIESIDELTRLIDLMATMPIRNQDEQQLTHSLQQFADLDGIASTSPLWLAAHFVVLEGLLTLSRCSVTRQLRHGVSHVLKQSPDAQLHRDAPFNFHGKRWGYVVDRLYQVRSATIHGGDPSDEKSALQRFGADRFLATLLTRAMTKAVLRQVISDPQLPRRAKDAYTPPEI